MKFKIRFMQLSDANLLDVGKAALGVMNCLSLSSKLPGFCRPGFNYCICNVLPFPPETLSRREEIPPGATQEDRALTGVK